jgi:hypothetical protein
MKSAGTIAERRISRKGQAQDESARESARFLLQRARFQTSEPSSAIATNQRGNSVIARKLPRAHLGQAAANRGPLIVAQPIYAKPKYLFSMLATDRINSSRASSGQVATRSSRIWRPCLVISAGYQVLRAPAARAKGWR